MFVVILFNRNKSDDVCKLYLFTEESNTQSKWHVKKSLDIMDPDSNPTVLLNAFYADEEIFLFTEWSCIIIGTDLKKK